MKKDTEQKRQRKRKSGPDDGEARREVPAPLDADRKRKRKREKESKRDDRAAASVKPTPRAPSPDTSHQGSTGLGASSATHPTDESAIQLPARPSKRKKSKKKDSEKRLSSPPLPSQVASRPNREEQASAGDSHAGSRLPPHSRVLAPMVGGSELAFRMLCRRYNADLCYTPMMYSGRFAEDPAYRAAEFHTCPEDRPLVAHFCGNDPAVLLQAARLVQERVDAVDLNLGCPQRIAHSGHFGSYLLDKEDRPLVLEIVRTLSRNLKIPVFCKIRLLESVDETVELCRGLAEAGCSLIAVHARYRGTATRRRDGPAHLDQLAKVIGELGPDFPCPVLSNGNVRTADDVLENQHRTGAAGIMSAEGLLDDPTLFAHLSPSPSPTTLVNAIASGEADAGDVGDQAIEKARKKITKKLKEIKRLRKLDRELSSEEAAKVATRSTLKKKLAKLDAAVGGEAPRARAAVNKDDIGSSVAMGVNVNNPLALAEEYLDLCHKYPSATLSTQIFHVRRMCKQLLNKYQLMAECCAAKSEPDLRATLQKCRRFADGTVPFVFDADREREAAEVLVRRKEEAAKRKAYDGRLTRKAKREGLPLDHYLKIGRDPPTHSDISRITALPKEEQIPAWRAEFGQHCFAFHCAEGGCARAKACAFFHTDISRVDPSWLQESTS